MKTLKPIITILSLSLLALVLTGCQPAQLEQTNLEQKPDEQKQAESVDEPESATQSACVYKDGSCCQGEQGICQIAQATCEDGKEPVIKGCDEKCEAVFECAANELEDVQGDSKITDSQKIIYPDDYILTSNEVPIGFELASIDEEAKKIGYTSNPGFFNNSEMFKELYNNANPAIIESVYSSVYINPQNSTTSELGIFIIKYKTTEGFMIELNKLNKQQDRLYLKNDNDNILMIIWNDGNEYKDQVRLITNKLKQKFNLKEVY